MRWSTRVAAGGVLCLALLGAPAVRSADPPLLPEWSSLRYEAENALGRVGGEIALREQPELTDTWVADVRTWFRPILLWDKGSETRVWFDPRDGAVARAIKRTIGPKPDQKIYRFTPVGTHRVRIEPDGAERQLEPERWSQIRESFFGFRPSEHGCDVVSDPAAILARISATVGVGAPAAESLCVLSGKTFYRVDFRSAGQERVPVNYRLATGEKRKGKIQAQRVSVHAHPVAGEPDAEPVDLEILVEPGSGLPVRIRTPVPGFGAMDVALVRATL